MRMWAGTVEDSADDGNGTAAPTCRSMSICAAATYRAMQQRQTRCHSGQHRGEDPSRWHGCKGSPEICFVEQAARPLLNWYVRHADFCGHRHHERYSWDTRSLKFVGSSVSEPEPSGS
eukprot:352421-Chlamydomonas_euryale.AAC.70